MHFQHRDTSGVVVPGTLADADEIIMIGKAVAEAGGGVYEMAQDFSVYDDIPGEKREPERVKEHVCHTAIPTTLTRFPGIS